MVETFNPPIKVVPTTNASKRTKNRTTEHSIYAVERHLNVACFNGAPGVLCYCRCDAHTKNPWVGWLPLGEVVFTSKWKLNIPKKETRSEEN